MADLKISQLTGATTPLAGTETLPIVQSGATKKVSVANLTAGRDTSVAKLNATDNIIVGTSGKGVTTAGAINLGFGTNGAVNELIVNTVTGAREFYNSYTGWSIINQGEGAFAWSNAGSATVDLAVLFPDINFTNKGVSLTLQITTGNNTATGSSILYHMNRTIAGTWTAASISAIGGGISVSSSSGSGTSITLNFSTTGLYGTAIARVVVQV